MIQLIPLGAGQDVGKSCIVVSLGGKTIMFDCGMHLGYSDQRKFPNFSLISKGNKFDTVLDAVIISHFHLDHCGALPFFSERCGYTGPIIMTHPTKAICPILLEDFRKIQLDRRPNDSSHQNHYYTSQDIKNCMKKVQTISVMQSLFLEEDFEIRAYYAGHVLGAAMFYVRVGSESVVYTGDYNMTPDRHLGAAWIERVKPNLLITETTYATTIRDSKRARERDFLKKVHDCVKSGGKVLIPVFALGRAQELCILIESFWERSKLNVPVYFSAGLTEKANNYYKLFINWTNQKLQKTFSTRNMFDFRHIKPFVKNLVDSPGPMVLFSSPGMLHSGMSLEVFKRWASDPKNMVIMPGYCVPGTLGAKLLQGQRSIMLDKTTKLDVKMQIQNLSFSAHADAKGILQLISQCEPDNVVLVHGDKSKMTFLKEYIKGTLGLPCFDPANGEILKIETKIYLPLSISEKALERKRDLAQLNIPFSGILVKGQGNSSAASKARSLSLLSPQELAIEEAGNERKIGRFCISSQIQLKEFHHLNLVEFVLERLCTVVPRESVRIDEARSRIKFHSVSFAFDITKGIVDLEWDYFDGDVADVLVGFLFRETGLM